MSLDPRSKNDSALQPNRDADPAAESAAPAGSRILNAFSNLQTARAVQVRSPEISPIEALWAQAKEANNAGDSGQELEICRTLMRTVDPANQREKVFFAEATCRAADILLIQRDYAGARDLLGEFEARADSLPDSYRPRALMLTAASRYLTGEVDDSEIDRLRFREVLLSTSDIGWSELLRPTDRGLITLLNLPCQPLTTRVVGDLIEGLQRGREHLHPEIYVTYLVTQAKLLVGQESPDLSFDRIRTCREVLEDTCFRDDDDVVMLHEQMAKVLSDIGMISEALKERSSAIAVAEIYGDTERVLTNRLAKFSLLNSLGDEESANGEFKLVRNALAELLPRWFFIEIKAPDSKNTLPLERIIPDASERQEFRIHAKIYSDLLLARMLQTMVEGERIEETMQTSEQISRIYRLIGDTPAVTDLLVPRVAASIFARQTCAADDIASLEEAATGLRPGTPRSCQVHYLLAIHKLREGFATEAAEHFELCESIFKEGSDYLHSLPMLELLTLKATYLLEAEDLAETASALGKAFQLREEFGLAFSEQGRVNLVKLVEINQALDNEELAARYSAQLAEVEVFLNAAPKSAE